MQKKNNLFFDHFEINHSQFKGLWIDALTQRHPSEALFFILDNFLNLLSSIIVNKIDHPYFASIIKMVCKDNKALALKQLNLWIKNSESVKQELSYIVVSRIHSIKKIPYQASPLRAFHFFLKDLRYEIVKQIQKQKEFINPAIDLFSSYSIEFDVTASFDPWERYLSFLYLQGFSKKEISDITNLSRQTIYIEEKKLCHYLKKKQLTI